MIDDNDEIETECPVCSPKTPVLHDILKSGQNPMVRCMDCEHIHPVTIEKKSPVDIRIIVSEGDRSFDLIMPMDPEDVVHVGEELIVDDETSGEAYPVIITSIESGDRRVQSAIAEKIDALWTRATGEVNVKISIHSGTETIPVTTTVPGDREFIVGEEEQVGGKFFVITQIKVRDGKFVSRSGNTVKAKHIKRVFGRKKSRNWGEGRTAWSLKKRRKE
ncbi:conserved hypothetical protein [Methanosalsum zhilinae DSM 4017]|uniref:Zn-finger protein-like protein n=1 Tax=Methanosalsum zhilinae (strain DSM 4017 / NBRC 107636 / OCM 62 / WeN5) TaxID=679901 RepID=F7XKG0_METZD|nr:HVO_0476 family zinc finger protein [Methanosalsum zhilinae]AEH61731.1 conserved hypothetical protein [Methanosalsum zhilinae DSM 4017]